MAHVLDRIVEEGQGEEDEEVDDEDDSCFSEQTNHSFQTEELPAFVLQILRSNADLSVCRATESEDTSRPPRGRKATSCFLWHKEAAEERGSVSARRAALALIKWLSVMTSHNALIHHNKSLELYDYASSLLLAWLRLF
ncbi:hypothetical protein Baya_11561 [Bagarius yarrelli]|uniref:Uncharacterized protein n=1 Tax=Bagarius yarrelli TaxID=175774 RepID=A0A556UZM4_BAGYA|nr:hypothetical protein Baya_11561 [Bagarius yarrelli]